MTLFFFVGQRLIDAQFLFDVCVLKFALGEGVLLLQDN